MWALRFSGWVRTARRRENGGRHLGEQKEKVYLRMDLPVSSWVGRGRFDLKPQPIQPEQVRQVGIITISTELAFWGCWRARAGGLPSGCPNLEDQRAAAQCQGQGQRPALGTSSVYNCLTLLPGLGLSASCATASPQGANCPAWNHLPSPEPPPRWARCRPARSHTLGSHPRSPCRRALVGLRKW